MSLLRNSPLKPTLNDRIAALREEIVIEIDKRAAEIKKSMEGVPIGVVRSILIRSSTCQCAAWNLIKDSDL